MEQHNHATPVDHSSHNHHGQHQQHSAQQATDHSGHAGHDKHAGHNPEMFKRLFFVCLGLTIPILYFEPMFQLWFRYQAISNFLALCGLVLFWRSSFTSTAVGFSWLVHMARIP